MFTVTNFRIASHCTNYACSVECKPRNVQRPQDRIEDEDDEYNLSNDSDLEEDEENVAKSGSPSQFYYTSLCEEAHDMR